MPQTAVSSMAKEKGIPRDRAEEIWQEAKREASKQGKEENYPYIMSIFKNMMEGE
ncbi:MAG: hypothetical protein ACLFUH_11135 [Bacteroidales bacterium]